MKIFLARKGEAGREILPVLNTASLIEIDEQFGGLNAAIEAMKADKGWRAATIRVVVILCNEGLIDAGERPDLTEEAVKRMIHPARIAQAGAACLEAIVRGMRMEHETKERPRDPVLEEIEKKTEPERAVCGS